jgi:hypothetical protein
MTECGNRWLLRRVRVHIPLLPVQGDVLRRAEVPSRASGVTSMLSSRGYRAAVRSIVPAIHRVVRRGVVVWCNT